MKMSLKKMSVCLIITLLIISLVTVGCGKKEEPKEQAQKEYKFVTGLMVDINHPYGNALKYMRDEMDKRTNGQVKIEIYGNRQLGSEADMMNDLLAKKEVNLLCSSVGNISPYIPEIDFFTLPYMYGDFEKFKKAMDGDVGDALKEMLKKQDLVTIAMFTAGDRNLLGRTKKVMKPEDLKGMKMRVWESPIVKETWAALGATPVVVANAETYTALQTGVVDAAENDVTTFLQMKWGETSKYVANTHHLLMPNPVFMRADTWNSLPEDIQKTFLEVGKEATEVMWNEQRQLQTDFTKELQDNGLEFYDVELEPFIKLTEPLRKSFSEKHNLMDLLEKTKKYR